MLSIMDLTPCLGRGAGGCAGRAPTRVGQCNNGPAGAVRVKEGRARDYRCGDAARPPPPKKNNGSLGPRGPHAGICGTPAGRRSDLTERYWRKPALENPPPRRGARHGAGSRPAQPGTVRTTSGADSTARRPRPSPSIFLRAPAGAL